MALGPSGPLHCEFCTTMPLMHFFKSLSPWSLALITLGFTVGSGAATVSNRALAIAQLSSRNESSASTLVAHTPPASSSAPAPGGSHGQPHHSQPPTGGHGGHGHGGGHSSLEIPAGQPVPTLEVIAHPDPRRGWNLEIRTTHFRFAPEEVNQANQPNAGHGHLYINGELGQRVYGPWLHIPQLPPGRNEITVTLNANSHETLTHNGQPIAATVVVMAP